ncbi:head GIN domain-containing protein [Noviherbaspirillum aridicola]|uniref:Putative auto-transporter adhesin head GIN domain-containing protein n=1 Tax=Noviherbaspirillum aridicola TaxID=2849687 RepID=A0ABQ4Q3I0_9BURK|nr:head GIN domain-containing protein [Noviherbaspirillum aridicola]GIZ51751.1 hypothetical protein NCCP691_17650 [Noviherbaspirillum aridicola]
MHPVEEMKPGRRALIAAIAAALVSPALPALADSASFAADGVTRVRYSLPGELLIRQGAQEKLVVEADPKVLQQLDVRVRGDQLVIASRGSFKTNKGIRLTLTLKSLRGLVADGSGNSRIEGFGGDAIEAVADGSGNIALANVKPAQLTLTIKGSGNIEADGSGNSLQASVGGSGEIDAAGFRAQAAQARIAGSGSIRVHAERDLQAVISGAGNIEYKGKAKVTESITGAGSVDRL